MVSCCGATTRMIKWIIAGLVLVILSSLAAASTDIPFLGHPESRLNRKDQLLDDMNPEQLGIHLDGLRFQLVTDMYEDYEDLLKNHEKTINKLQAYKMSGRQRRQAPNLFSSGRVFSDLPSWDYDVGTSYRFNTGTDNRKMVEIDKFRVESIAGNQQVSATYSLELENIPAILKDGSTGFGYYVGSDGLQPVHILNKYTKSTTGCPCIDGRLECACCYSGSSQCPRGDTCTPIGQKSVCQIGHKNVELNAAVAFKYHLERTEVLKHHESSTENIVITAEGNVIKFYSSIHKELRSKVINTGASYHDIGRTVTHLGYGETLIDSYFIARKKRFIFTFKAGERTQDIYEINVDGKVNDIDCGYVGSWDADFGEEMEVVQVGARILIFVKHTDRIKIYEYKMDTFRYGFRMHFFSEVKFFLSEGGSFVSWHLYKNHFNAHIVIHYSNKCITYHLRGSTFEMTSILQPDGFLTQFDAILPLKISKCDDQVVLLAVQGSKGIVYVWNGITGVYEIARQINIAVSGVKWNVAVTWSLSSETQIIVPTPNGLTKMYLLGHLFDLPSPIYAQNRRIHDHMHIIEAEFIRQMEIYDLTLVAIENAFTLIENPPIRGNITILNPVTLNKRLITHEIQDSKVNVINVVMFEDMEATLSLWVEPLVIDIRKLQVIISNILDDTVSLSGSEVKITGIKNYHGSLSQENEITYIVKANECQCLGKNCQEQEMHLRFEKFVKKEFVGAVHGKKTFTGGIAIQTLYCDALDGINIWDIVTTTTKQTITGATFNTMVKIQGQLTFGTGWLLAGKDLSQAVTLTGTHTLGTVVSTSSVSIEYCYVNMIDGISMFRLLFFTLTRVGPVTLYGSLEINGHLTVTVNTDATTVMNVNFNQYLVDVVYLNRPAVITGTLTFNSLVTIYSYMTVNNFINGKVFPDDFLIQGPELNFVDAHFMFAIFNEIQVHGYVDTVLTSNLVTITTNQVIKDIKRFNLGVHVKNDLHITTGMIDYFNITAYRPSNKLVKYNTFTFLKHVTVDLLNYTDLFNRINLKIEADDIIYMDEGPVVINSVKHFSKGLIVANVNLQARINALGLHLFVKTFSRQSIHGIKTMKRQLIFNALIVEGTVDGVDILSLIKNAVYLNKRYQVITGRKIITTHIEASSIKIHNLVNSIDWTSLVTLTGSYVFNDKQTFNTIITNTVNVDHIICSNGVKIDDIDISEYARLRILLHGSNQNIGILTVSGVVTASSVTAVTVNHVNMEILLSNLCYKHEDIVITSSSNIHFTYLDVRGFLTTFNSNGANGLSLAWFSRKAVYLQKDNTFLVDMAYWVKILAEDITVYGKIDGVQIDALAFDAVYISDDLSPCLGDGCNIISGRKIFKGGFAVEGNIEADLVNGVDYSTVLFTKDTDQTITGIWQFTSVTAESKVYLYGDFNECLQPIFGTSGNFKNINGNFKAYVDVIFHETIYARRLNCNGSLNELDIENELKTAIRLDQKIAITDIFTFEAGVNFGVLNLIYLNEVEWSFFMSDLILSTDTYYFNSNFVLDGSIIVATCDVTESFIWQGTIDGIVLSDIISDAIYINQDYELDATWEVSTGQINVYGNLIVSLFNGVSTSLFLTTNTVQAFTSTMVTFDTCTTMGYNIVVKGFVNSVNLLEEYQKTWFDKTSLSGKNFTGHCVVRGDVSVEGDVGVITVDLLDNIIYINDSFSTHTIEGKVVFLSPLKIVTLSNINDVKINSVNLLEIEENAWFKDVSTTITGSFTMNKKTKFKKELITSTTIINSVDVLDVYYETNITMIDYNTQLTILKTNYSLYCKPNMFLCQTLEYSIHELDYMEKISTFTYQYERHSSYSFQVRGITFLLMTWKDRCETTVYRWDVQSLGFVEVTTFESGYAHNWDSFPSSLNGMINLVMSSDNENSLCSRQNSAIWEFQVTMTSNSITVSVTMVQELEAGVSLAILGAEHNAVLHIYGSIKTFHYSYSVENIFEIENEEAEHYSKYVYAFDSNGNEVGFEVQLQLRNSVVNVYINGEFESSHFCGGMTTDAVAVEQHGNVRLILLVDENVLSLKTNALNIKYLVAFSLEDIADATMRLVSYIVVNGGDSLVDFNAGGTACACPLITLFSASYESVTYAFQGDEFSLWTTMPLSITPSIWGLPFKQTMNDAVDEKLLMYSYSTTEAVVMVVRLRGRSQVDTSMTCDADVALPLLAYDT